MRLKLVARDALAHRMEAKGWSNRQLAAYVAARRPKRKCAPGTIDNLLNGRTKAVNDPRVAELICEALDVPLDVFFVPETSSNAGRSDKVRKVAA